MPFIPLSRQPNLSEAANDDNGGNEHALIAPLILFSTTPLTRLPSCSIQRDTMRYDPIRSDRIGSQRIAGGCQLKKSIVCAKCVQKQQHQQAPFQSNESLRLLHSVSQSSPPSRLCGGGNLFHLIRHHHQPSLLQFAVNLVGANNNNWWRTNEPQTKSALTSHKWSGTGLSHRACTNYLLGIDESAIIQAALICDLFS